MKQLKDMGEDALIRHLVRGLGQGQEVIVGPGDDCAVIDVQDAQRYQLLKTDCLVERVHYLPDAPADQVGWKAIARVVSDFAAMGGWPAHLLVTLVMPAACEVRYLEGLYEGMQRCAGKYGATICGGETSSAPDGSAAVISVSGTGWVAKECLVRRDRGRVGDRVLVTGLLGGSIHGKHLTFTPRVQEAAWLTANADLHAMMDLSDGLAKDLPRLARLSGCGYRIDESSIPCSDGSNTAGAMGDGEDYELMFCVAADDLDELLLKWAKAYPDLPLTDVGELVDISEQAPLSERGWEHFTT